MERNQESRLNMENNAEHDLNSSIEFGVSEYARCCQSPSPVESERISNLMKIKIHPEDISDTLEIFKDRNIKMREQKKQDLIKKQTAGRSSNVLSDRDKRNIDCELRHFENTRLTSLDFNIGYCLVSSFVLIIVSALGKDYKKFIVINKAFEAMTGKRDVSKEDWLSTLEDLCRMCYTDKFEMCMELKNMTTSIWPTVIRRVVGGKIARPEKVIDEATGKEALKSIVVTSKGKNIAYRCFSVKSRYNAKRSRIMFIALDSKVADPYERTSDENTLTDLDSIPEALLYKGERVTLKSILISCDKEKGSMQQIDQGEINHHITAHRVNNNGTVGWVIFSNNKKAFTKNIKHFFEKNGGHMHVPIIVYNLEELPKVNCKMQISARQKLTKPWLAKL